MRRKLAVIAAAVVVLAVAVAAVSLARPWETGRLWGIEFEDAGSPQVVRTFTGAEADPLLRPVAVRVYDRKLYVADAQRGVVDVFSPGGHSFGGIGKGVLRTPVSVARHPLTGDLYVADRALEAVLVFDDEGIAQGPFAPRVPSGAAWSSTPTALWSPLSLDFSDDGYLFVTDARNRHRVLIFRPDGQFEREADRVPASASGGESLEYPAAIEVDGNEVWVADSNNMRLVVYDVSGRFLRVVDAPRLPRSIAFLRGSSGKNTALIADPMSHRIGAVDARSGKSAGGFGSMGQGESQLSYPNAAAVANGDIVVVADTGNSRIAIWSWAGISAGNGAGMWWWGLLLIPLLPLLALPAVLKRPRYFVTVDFLKTVEEAGRMSELTDLRAVWECLPEDWDEANALELHGGPFGLHLQPVKGSESDLRAMRERYHLSDREAAVFTAARGVAEILTTDEDIIRLAPAVGFAAITPSAFLDRNAAEREREVHRKD